MAFLGAIIYSSIIGSLGGIIGSELGDKSDNLIPYGLIGVFTGLILGAVFGSLY